MIDFYFNPSTEKHFPDMMPIEVANDNYEFMKTFKAYNETVDQWRERFEATEEA
jgi:hypothetical protein